MENDAGSLEKVPLPLRRAHAAACWAYKWMNRSYSAIQQIIDFSDPSPDDDLSQEEQNKLERQTAAYYDHCARLIVRGRARLASADRLVGRKSGEFAAVAHELRQWELHNHYKDDGWLYGTIISRSVHDFAVGIAAVWLNECLRGIVAEKKGGVWLHSVSDEEISALADRDIRQYIRGVAVTVEHCEELPSDVDETLRQLRGEVLRAAQRAAELQEQLDAARGRLSKAEEEIMDVIRCADKRLTTKEIIGELERRNGAASEGTTKVTLANLMRRGLLDNRQDEVPKGYGVRNQ